MPLVIAASILVARKLGQLDAQPTPALENTISEAIALADKIMRKIDQLFATPPDQRMTSGVAY